MGPLRIVCFLIDSIGVASLYENKFVLNRRRRYRAAPCHRLFPSQNRSAGCYYHADFFLRELKNTCRSPRDRDGTRRLDERHVPLRLNRNDDFDSCHFIVARAMSYFGCRPVIDYEKFSRIFAPFRGSLRETKL